MCVPVHGVGGLCSCGEALSSQQDSCCKGHLLTVPSRMSTTALCSCEGLRKDLQSRVPVPASEDIQGATPHSRVPLASPVTRCHSTVSELIRTACSGVCVCVCMRWSVGLGSRVTKVHSITGERLPPGATPAPSSPHPPRQMNLVSEKASLILHCSLFQDVFFKGWNPSLK